MSEIGVRMQAPTAPDIPGEHFEWQGQARCADVDPEMFFPVNKADDTRAARRICADCPVRIECLNYAITAREQHGIFGGLDAHQRNKLRRYAA